MLPSQLYPDTDAGRRAMIADLNVGNAAMQAKLPRAFNNPPNNPLEIRRVPPEIQDGASNGYYYSAALDGSRPAIYWINLKSVGDWPKYSLPALTYHEGVPGHHLQGGIQQAAGDLPLLLSNYFLSATARAGRSMPRKWPTNWAATRGSSGPAICSRSCSAPRGW